MNGITATITKYNGRYKKLSNREKAIIWGGVLLLGPLFLNQLVVKPVRERLEVQAQNLEQLQQDLRTIPHILNRYLQVAAKKSAIENEFRQVEIKEGEQSLLETILTGKVDPGFSIDPSPPRAFGGNYEQASFAVRFTTNSLQTLVALLTEITTGSKRMLLTSLVIGKDPTGEKLRVDISVSSIRKLR